MLISKVIFISFCYSYFVFSECLSCKGRSLGSVSDSIKGRSLGSRSDSVPGKDVIPVVIPKPSIEVKNTVKNVTPVVNTKEPDLINKNVGSTTKTSTDSTKGTSIKGKTGNKKKEDVGKVVCSTTNDSKVKIYKEEEFRVALSYILKNVGWENYFIELTHEENKKTYDIFTKVNITTAEVNNKVTFSHIWRTKDEFYDFDITEDNIKKLEFFITIQMPEKIDEDYENYTMFKYNNKMSLENIISRINTIDESYKIPNVDFFEFYIRNKSGITKVYVDLTTGKLFCIMKHDDAYALRYVKKIDKGVIFYSDECYYNGLFYGKNGDIISRDEFYNYSEIDYKNLSEVKFLIEPPVLK